MFLSASGPLTNTVAFTFTAKKNLAPCFIWLSSIKMILFYLVFPSSIIVCRRRQWHPTPVLLPGKSHGWRSLVGCSPGGQYKSRTWLSDFHFNFSLSCIGEGNGNPLQYSCLENPKDGGAWWVAIYEVVQSQTRLKQLSSSIIVRKGFPGDLACKEPACQCRRYKRHG